ncbi:NUDIX domain-containing protein [Streptomyces sp. NA04227]|uniref:NUDIX hydrolase n=1 Tax=Streptomyces sp. NA04227 TaxID=2742136 RepID=UPI0015909615|nr:NUDIX domain-containing protein [Streptomyces sp. NA04227]QKW05224.1 NUDIX domain-containing protein [Streptomyces sp. NA04227]
MIVWINGAYGAGKTSAARELSELLPESTLFDPGAIHAALVRMAPSRRLAEADRIGDLSLWRRLTVEAIAALHAEVGGVLIVPLSVLRQEHRDELFGSLAARRIEVRHLVLAPAETILRARAERALATCADESRLPCAAERDPRHFRSALATWLAEDAYVIDNGTLTPYETAVRIAEAVTADEAPVSDIVQTPEPRGQTLASGVLLFDAHERVLLVDPTYKAGWEFPGGVVEKGEPPARAGMREVTEETGLVLGAPPRLLVVDWEWPAPPGHGGLRLLFDGGKVDEGQQLTLPGGELRDWRFVTEAEAERLLPPVRFTRLRWALRARERGCAMYLEGGVPVG